MSEQRLLTRPRLLKQLTNALQRGHLCILAPGGYGKTVLLHSLARQRPQTYYVALTLADADQAHLARRLQDLLQKKAATIILDDVHHLQEAQTTLNWLCTHLATPQPRLILSGRQLLLPKTGIHLLYLDSHDLAFSPAESRAWLVDEGWYAQTAGWPLALDLARQLAEHAPYTAPHLATTALFDYLAHTLFARLPDELLHFMHLTSAAQRFNLALASYLTPQASRLLAEVQQHNLYLESVTDQPGWFKYHDLIRNFLRTTATMTLQPVYASIVDWFNAEGDFEAAIDHALEGGLEQQACRFIQDVPRAFLWDQGRYLTYRRWVLSLSAATLAQAPDLLVNLASNLNALPGYEAESWELAQQAVIYAEAQADLVTQQKAELRMALFAYRRNHYEDALHRVERLLRAPTLVGRERLYALRLVTLCESELAHFQAARRAFEAAIHYAMLQADPEEQALNQQNLALTVLIPLGEFQAARIQLEAAAAYLEATPGLHLRGLLSWCEYHLAMGNWPALTQVLTEFADRSRPMETLEAADQLWPRFYRAALLTAQGDFTVAATTLATFAASIEPGFDLGLVCAAWAKSWLQRRQGDAQAALATATDILAGSLRAPFYRALVALEGAIAHWLAAPDAAARGQLPVEARQLIAWRARAELVRLRALLALQCWFVSKPHWRRHVQAVLHRLKQPGYGDLLTRRDPDLGAHFWTLLLMEGIAPAQAHAALLVIGDWRPLITALAGRSSHFPAEHLAQCDGWQIRVAHLVAASQVEAAIPALQTALTLATDTAVIAALEQALTTLESQPPPPLAVTLLGDFQVMRAGETLPDTAWTRPLVKKLFQYFALHRGTKLARDRILEDLWPNDDPQAAAGVFRTVHSRLRNALEPHLRAKAPSRYFRVEGDVYQFDPQQRVTVDVEIFRQTVQQTLQQAVGQDIPPLPLVLVTALEHWQPLLAHLPYEEWLLTAREQVQTLYVEGCLYLANAYLVRHALRDAIHWAQAALTQAPWLEEAYQIRIRGHARLDERSLALKVYEQAVAVLERELAVPPAPLTTWLAERLRNGEEI